ncbi:hypothetical protein ES705_50907 [subsurface metagenome]
MSSHINNSISKEFQKLVKETDEGKLTKEEALARSYALREKPNNPEDISIENIDSTFDFLNNEEYLDEVYRENERKEELIRQTQKENKRLQAELDRRDKIDKERDAKEQVEREQRERIKIEHEFNQQKTNYILSQWKNERKKKTKDLLFIGTVIFFTFCVIFSGIALKLNKNLSTWLESLGNGQYLIWAIYALILTTELLGRSYFFNKERMLNGWIFFRSLFKYSVYKSNYNRKSEEEFIANNKQNPVANTQYSKKR